VSSGTLRKKGAARLSQDTTLQRPDIRPVLHQRGNADAEYREDIGQTKRFLERFAADAVFREALAQNPREAAARWGLKRDPEEIRQLWETPGAGMCAPAQSLAVARYRAYVEEKRRFAGTHRDMGLPGESRWRAWRNRQILRCESHLGPKARLLVHAPFCIELGKGCSVGCWFCAVSAEKLGDQLPYTADNARWWRECLEVLREITGDGAHGGYCYWSNDPLDNPDYERFMVDFHDVIGYFPQTTTAQPDRHVDRVRALLKLAEQKGGVIDRFSVLTLPQWNRIHEAFDAAELAFVECIPQNKEAIHPGKVIAGKALEKEKRLVAKGKAEPTPEHQTSTIACVSGFYLNMVDRRVQLITPCNACDRWPLGHWLLDEGTFHDAASLRALLLRMIGDNMKVRLGPDDRVAFRRDLSYEAQDGGFAVTSPFRRHSVKLPQGMHALGEAIRAGGSTAAELALSTGRPLEETFHFLNDLLYSRGLLDEEPAGSHP
jgi:radical SAM family RiPP maturation amino acid epimerase